MRLVVLAFALVSLPVLWVGSVAHAAFSDESTASGTVTAASEFSPADPTYLVYLGAIDTEPGQEPANTATSVGSIEPCISVPAGDSFDVDVVIRSDIEQPGVAGFQYVLRFDGSVLEVTAANHEMFLASGGTPVVADLSGPLPSTTGTWSAAAADFSDFDEVGDGVLTRITLRAKAGGLSHLALDDLLVVGGPAGTVAFTGHWTTIQNAIIAVGQPCPESTPAPSSPPPTGVPASVTPSPAGTSGATPAPATGTPPTTVTPTPTPTATPLPSGTGLPTPSPAIPTSPPGATPASTPTPTATPSGTPTLTATPTPTPTATVGGLTQSPTPVLAGDAGCDGAVDLGDAIAILIHLGGGDALPCADAADVTCDDAITPDDVMALLKWRGGLDVELPGGCPAIAS